MDPPVTLNGPGYTPARGRARLSRSAACGVAPRKLGHVLLFTPDMERLMRFYTGTLGMKLSDRSRGIIAFLRCNTDHHTLALLSSHAPGFHHGSFQVGSVDEIAMGAVRMAERGWQPGWGLGRHVIGSNFFYLHPRSVGQLQRVLLRPRLHPGGLRVGAARFPARGFPLRMGPAVPGRLRREQGSMDLEFLHALVQPATTKIVLCSLDGLGGLPRPETGKSELETARIPNLHALAGAVRVRAAAPRGARASRPGSGPGHLGLFGYDPLRYPVGRGVLEALGIDFELRAGDVAARGNFCTVDARGHITDRRAGRISTEVCVRLVRAAARDPPATASRSSSSR